MEVFSAKEEKMIWTLDTAAVSYTHLLPYQMTQEKGLYRYTITSNGAQVVDLEEKKTIFRMLMKRERVVQFLRECEGLNVVRMTHIQHRYVMEGPLMEVAGRIVYGLSLIHI